MSDDNSRIGPERKLKWNVVPKGASFDRLQKARLDMRERSLDFAAISALSGREIAYIDETMQIAKEELETALEEYVAAHKQF